MPLQKQVAVIPLKGMNTHADPKSAEPGECTLIENMHFKRTTPNAGELRKRFGATRRTPTVAFGGPAIVAGKRLATWKDEQLQVADGSLFAWGPEQSAWMRAGDMGSQRILGEPVTANFGIVSRTDVAIGGGLICVTYLQDGTAALATVIDLVTGQRYMDGAVVTSVTTTSTNRAHVVALANRFVIFLAKNGNANLTARFIDYSAPSTVGAETTVATNFFTAADTFTAPFDVIRNGSNDHCYVAYGTTGANKLEVNKWLSNMTSAGTVGNANVVDQCMGWLSWDGSDTNQYLAYTGAAVGTKLITVSTTLTISATTTVDAAVVAARNVTGYRAGSTNFVFAGVDSATLNTEDSIFRWNGSGSLVLWQRGMNLASKAFVVSSTMVVLMAHYSGQIQRSYFALNAVGATPVHLGGAYFGQAGDSVLNTGGRAGGRTYPAHLASVAAVSSTHVVVAGLRAAPQWVDRKSPMAYLTHIDFGAAIGQAKQLGDNLHFAGGCVRQFSGASPNCELNFRLFPEAPANLTQSNTGVLTLLGTYQLCLVYAVLDGRGQITRSAPSPIATITLTGANNSIGLDAQNMRCSDRVNLSDSVANCRIEIYRTVANGSSFFLDSTFRNHTDNEHQSLGIGGTDDTTLSAQIPLYTTGGVLAHIPPPPATLMETWRGRLFLAGTDVPNELWISNERVSGEGVSFSDQNVITLEEEGGDITALAELDDRLVVFKKSAIYELSGQGPALNGDGQFEQPARVCTGVGAVSPLGVVKTSQGVVFKSARGFYLLPRGGAQPIRLTAVEAYESLTLTGSVVLDDVEEVRFVHAEGRTLVYHFGLLDERGIGRWTTFTGQAAVDTAVFAGQWAYLQTDGGVQLEVSGQFADNGSPVTALVTLAFLNLAQLFGRIKLYGVSLLCDFLGTTVAALQVAYDFDPTIAETDTKVVGVSTLSPLMIAPARRRVTAIQVNLSEASSTEGFRLSALGVEIGVEPGAVKLPVGQFLS